MSHTPMCLGCWEALPDTPDGTRRDFHGKECKRLMKKRLKERKRNETRSTSSIIAPTDRNLAHALEREKKIQIITSRKS